MILADVGWQPFLLSLTWFPLLAVGAFVILFVLGLALALFALIRSNEQVKREGAD